MNQYEFTLGFRLGNAEQSPEQYVEKLGASGCNDALIGIGKLGSISLNFNRKSESALKAISTAIQDVKKAIPDATLTEATPDFVGMTEIADVYGTTRQYIRKVVTTQSRSFPAPAHEGNPSLWHLADVLGWIGVHEPEKLDDKLFEMAKLNMQINSYKAFMKASLSSGLSVDFNAGNSRKDADWIHIIHDAMGSFSETTPDRSSRRAQKKARTA